MSSQSKDVGHNEVSRLDDEPRPTVPGAVSVDGAPKKHNKKGKGLSRLRASADESTGNQPVPPNRTGAVLEVGAGSQPVPPNCAGAVLVVGAPRNQKTNSKGFSGRLLGRREPSAGSIGIQSMPSTGASGRSPTRASRENSPVPSISGRGIMRGLSMRTKKSPEQSQQSPAKQIPGVKTQQVDPADELEQKTVSAQTQPGYMRYVSEEMHKSPPAVSSDAHPQPSYVRYISEEMSSHKLDDIAMVDQGPSPVAEENAAIAPQLQREPAVAAQREPGAYPLGFDMVDENEWQQDGHLDAGVVPGNESNPNAAPSQNPEGLAVANPVHSQQFSLDLDEARHVDPAVEERRKKEQNRKSRRLLIGMLLTAFLLLAGIVIVLVFVIGGDSSTIKEDTNTTLATMSEEDFLLNLLPDHTINAIQADEYSPQARAFAWLLGDPDFPSFPDWRKIQRFALATFFYATGGQDGRGWVGDDNWLSYGSNECDWFASDNLGPSNPELEMYGVEASYPPLAFASGLCGMGNESDGSVERLAFNANGLKGTLPQELSLLTSLKIFGLLANPVTGTIPTEMGQLTNLEFFGSVVSMKIGGSLPSELGNARNLTHLIFFRGQLTGSIPSEFGSLPNLKVLVTDEQGLNGTLPTELGLLSNSIWVSSYNNALTGTVPTQLGQLSSVRFLGIYNNRFSPCKIPSQLGMLTSVQELNIEKTPLTGTIPTELGGMTSMEKLYLATTQLSGPIPSELSKLTNMRYLGLGNSRLTGQFPPKLFELPNIRVINAPNGRLSGSLPIEMFRSSSLRALIFEKHHFTGSIPTEIGLMSDLREFYFYVNSITGTLPTEIGLLTSLRGLNLMDNDISGVIPTEMGQLSKLQQLGIHRNRITGTIPSELGLLSELGRLELSTNRVSGTIPTELLGINSLAFLGIGNNSLLSGALPPGICTNVGDVEVNCSQLECPNDCSCECVFPQDCRCSGGSRLL